MSMHAWCQLSPLHLVMRVVLVSPMWFKTHHFWVLLLLQLLRIRMTSTLFRMHPSLFVKQSTQFPPVSPSTPFYQPLCSSPTCLSPVFIILQQLFKLPCHFESVGIFSCVGDILPFELPPASKSRLQPFHCPLPVIEGTLCRFTCTSPPNLSIPHHTSHIHPLSRYTHSFDSPCQPSIHPFSEFFTVFYSVCAWLVLAGPVDWTENMTKTELNPTAKDQTTSGGCPDPEVFQLLVPRFDKKRKDQGRLVWTSCNWSFHSIYKVHYIYTDIHVYYVMKRYNTTTNCNYLY